MTSTSAQQANDPIIGRQLGNLRVVERIGHGGFGVVYRAEHSLLGTSAAIKILRMHAITHHEVMERFRREAKIVSQLNHPNVIRVLDYGEVDGSYYISMELLTGQSLKEAFVARRTFSNAEIISWFDSICSTLGYLHQQGIIHRDLKPANIFLHREKQHGPEIIKILDFGVAALANSKTLTASGTPLGSPVYMPPEQAKGDSKNVDARADIYSLSVILYEFLTGSKPFQGDGFAAVLIKQLTEDAPLLKDSHPNTNWSQKLENLLKRGMAKEADKRPQDVESFFAELKEALEEQQHLTPGMSFPPVVSTHQNKAVESVYEELAITDMVDPSEDDLLPVTPSASHIAPILSHIHTDPTKQMKAVPYEEEAAQKNPFTVKVYSPLSSSPQEEEQHETDPGEQEQAYLTEEEPTHFSQKEHTPYTPMQGAVDMQEMETTPPLKTEQWREPEEPPPVAEATQESIENVEKSESAATILDTSLDAVQKAVEALEAQKQAALLAASTAPENIQTSPDDPILSSDSTEEDEVTNVSMYPDSPTEDFFDNLQPNEAYDPYEAFYDPSVPIDQEYEYSYEEDDEYDKIPRRIGILWGLTILFLLGLVILYIVKKL